MLLQRRLRLARERVMPIYAYSCDCGRRHEERRKVEGMPARR